MMRWMNLMFTAALGAGLLTATGAGAQDYAREKRWAGEIMPAIVVGDAVQVRAASGRDFLGILTPGKPGRPALVLAHGVGVHPDHGVIGILRAKLADLGYTTLSIQMPVASKEATVDDYYPKVFPDAADRLHKAGEWLKARGHTNVVLISHSMGAWMANEYLDARHADTPYRAWVVMGLTGAYSWTMRRYKFPILDIYGENDLPPVVKAEGRRKSALDSNNGSRQVRIAGADHFYDKHENALTVVIDVFVRETVRETVAK